MPYILVHPLPPPWRYPYYPEVPTFTTSSRAVADFFHGHGWRAKHIHAPPNALTQATRTSSSSHLGPNTTSCLPPYIPEPEDVVCCHNSTSCFVSCGEVVELHCYSIDIDAAMFWGAYASERQLTYLLYYARGHYGLQDEDGMVELRVLNHEAMVRQRKRDAMRERRERRRVGGQCAVWSWVARVQKDKEEAEKLKKEAEQDEDEVVEPMDEDVDEELGRLWDQTQRALLATGELEWTEAGESLRKIDRLE